MAVNEETATIRDVAAVEIVKALTVGAVVSGWVMVTVAERFEETFPAASLAQAWAVLLPADEKVKLAGTEAVQPVALAAGAMALSEIR